MRGGVDPVRGFLNVLRGVLGVFFLVDGSPSVRIGSGWVLSLGFSLPGETPPFAADPFLPGDTDWLLDTEGNTIPDTGPDLLVLTTMLASFVS